MNIEELGKLMVKNGACIRAIPNVVRSVVDARHIDKYPDGEIVFMPEYGREMLVIKRVPKHVGQFLVKTRQGTTARIDFNWAQFYNSLTEAIDALVNLDKEV